MNRFTYFTVIRVVSVIIFAFLLTAFLVGLPIDVLFAWTEQTVSQTNREDAYRANNIGVAQLEQYNHQEGAALFRKALELDPNMKIARINLAIALFNAQKMSEALESVKIAAQIAPELPQPFYMLGLIARTTNRTDEAVAAFQHVLKGDPGDVGSNINLGQIYIQKSDYEKAVKFLRLAIKAEPYNSTAMYNLATALLRTGAREEGKELLTQFQALKKSGSATNIGQKYLEQGRYAEAITSTGAESELVNRSKPDVTFRAKNIGLPLIGNSDPNSDSTNDTYFRKNSAALFDFDNDADLDLVMSDAKGLRIFENEKGNYTDITERSGDLGRGIETPIFGVLAGDYDNDDLTDILAFGTGTPILFRNSGDGKFEDVTKRSMMPASNVTSVSGAFVDADHDGDLDIFLGGFSENIKKPDQPAASRLIRNNGDGTFEDVTAESGLGVPGRAVSVVPTDYDNRRDVDLFVLNRDNSPSLFRNLRDRTFKNVAAEVGLDQKGDWTCAAAGDFNKDSYTDFFFGRKGGRGFFAVSDGKGNFGLEEAPTGTENSESAQFIDYDNDGLLDLIVNTADGFSALRYLGDGWSKPDPSAFEPRDLPSGSRQILSGDVDSDGDIDLFAFDQNGNLRFLDNVGGNINNSETFGLRGRASNWTGIGAKIELRSGSLSQKLETYSASPNPAPADIHFGLGKRTKTDAVRVIWSSGIVQAEVEFAEKSASAKISPLVKIEELDRKPSSCPYIYAWNGERFEFVTDFLGGGEMGNWQEAGVYHYPDSDEFVRITSDQLKPKNGKYELRVTNELEEVLFLDHIKLIAVEHDADREVYPNEGLGIPTAGEQILYSTQNEYSPASAVDDNGRNVLPRVNDLDRVFYDNFKSQNIRGYAETHNLTLNLDDKNGFNGRTLLLLTGWTDYAFSSDNIAASQSGRSLFLPKLQVKNANGEWQTVIESIGLSVGRPQTVVVDLTGKFLTDSREVRIVTNFKTYWDKISVDTSSQKISETRELRPVRAVLRERGFSEEVRYGEMISANYDTVINDGRWKYFSGAFTRTGAVDQLLKSVDDVFVISKTGDELVLSFDAMPKPKEGRKYTFMLYADGYSKEMDINSGSPDAVFPLPFKSMKKYPYDSGEQYPMDNEKLRIYEKYTTRSVRGFVPSIDSYLVR